MLADDDKWWQQVVKISEENSKRHPEFASPFDRVVGRGESGRRSSCSLAIRCSP